MNNKNIDITELSNEYMLRYRALISDFDSLKIDDMVHNLNDAVKTSNVEQINIFFNELMMWNTQVSNLYGAHQALDRQYPYLHLPSPSSYSVVFDQEQKIWMFNT